MSSGEFLALSVEPSGVIGAAKVVGFGISSGVTLAVATVQANPELAAAATPDLKTSIWVLIGSVLVAAAKSYLPSEKKVDTQFQGVVAEVKAGHSALSQKLLDFATGAKEDEARRDEERRKHYQMLYTWMGATDQKFEAMDKRFDATHHRLDKVDERLGGVDKKIAVIEKRNTGELVRPKTLTEPQNES